MSFTTRKETVDGAKIRDLIYPTRFYVAGGKGREHGPRVEYERGTGGGGGPEMITAKRFPVYTGSIVFTGGGSRKTTVDDYWRNDD